MGRLVGAARRPFCSVELVKEHLKNCLGVLIRSLDIHPAVVIEDRLAVAFDLDLRGSALFVAELAG